MANTCDSCGARLNDGAVVCDLCGTPVDGAEIPLEDMPQSVSEPGADQQASESGVVFCNACGWSNPDGANFCTKCGGRLQVVDASGSKKGAPAFGSTKKTPPAIPAESRPLKTTPDDSNKAVGKQIGIIVVSALLVVLALYVVTTVSKNSALESATLMPLDPGTEEPLASQFVPRQRELQAKIEGLEGDALVAARRELVDLYFSAGRFDMAAAETELIAAQVQTENEWAVAGNLYYDWMERKEPSQKMPWARKAIAAYQEVLKINPANLDVRTDMAIAYMYDPQNSMMAIQETNNVLAQDSLHMQANFNRGIMLMQIDRREQAAAQFEKVMDLISDPEDPVYQRARQLAERLRAELSQPNS